MMAQEEPSQEDTVILQNVADDSNSSTEREKDSENSGHVIYHEMETPSQANCAATNDHIHKDQSTGPSPLSVDDIQSERADEAPNVSPAGESAIAIAIDELQKNSDHEVSICRPGSALKNVSPKPTSVTEGTPVQTKDKPSSVSTCTKSTVSVAISRCKRSLPISSINDNGPSEKKRKTIVQAKRRKQSVSSQLLVLANNAQPSSSPQNEIKSSKKVLSISKNRNSASDEAAQSATSATKSTSKRPVEALEKVQRRRRKSGKLLREEVVDEPGFEGWFVRIFFKNNNREDTFKKWVHPISGEQYRSRVQAYKALSSDAKARVDASASNLRSARKKARVSTKAPVGSKALKEALDSSKKKRNFLQEEPINEPGYDGWRRLSFKRDDGKAPRKIWFHPTSGQRFPSKRKVDEFLEDEYRKSINHEEDAGRKLASDQVVQPGKSAARSSLPCKKDVKSKTKTSKRPKGPIEALEKVRRRRCKSGKLLREDAVDEPGFEGWFVRVFFRGTNEKSTFKRWIHPISGEEYRSKVQAYKALSSDAKARVDISTLNLPQANRSSKTSPSIMSKALKEALASSKKKPNYLREVPINEPGYDGWKKLSFKRSNGGIPDKVWFHPTTGERFRSKKKVNEFLKSNYPKKVDRNLASDQVVQSAKSAAKSPFPCSKENEESNPLILTKALAKSKASETFFKEEIVDDPRCNGWYLHIHQRMSEGSLKRDKVWFNSSGKKFYSKPAVDRFLASKQVIQPKKNTTQYSSQCKTHVDINTLNLPHTNSGGSKKKGRIQKTAQAGSKALKEALDRSKKSPNFLQEDAINEPGYDGWRRLSFKRPNGGFLYYAWFHPTTGKRFWSKKKVDEFIMTENPTTAPVCHDSTIPKVRVPFGSSSDGKVLNGNGGRIEKIVMKSEKKVETSKSFISIWAEGRFLNIEYPMPGVYKKRKSFVDNGVTYELIASKLKNGNGKSWMSHCKNKVMFATYIATKGPGLEEWNLKKKLEEIADFSALPSHKIASRLTLLQTPALREEHIWCIDSAYIEVIEERHNEGCGFVPEDFFNDMIESRRSERIDSAQVRLIGPSSIGIAKGMLVKKNGITKIQLPPSMLKVDPSRLKRVEKCVTIIAKGVFPSDSGHWRFGRFLDPEAEKLSKSEIEKWDKGRLSKSYSALLCGLGVNESTLRSYTKKATKSIAGVKHFHLKGVVDPTGKLPTGCIFIPGFTKDGTSNRRELFGFCHKEVFVTKSPCLQPSDGKLLRVVGTKPKKMSQGDWKFLCGFKFGHIVFAVPESSDMPSLPSLIGENDLDGDDYFVLWDQTIVSELRDSKVWKQKTVPRIKKNGTVDRGNAAKNENPKGSTKRSQQWLSNSQDLMLDFDRYTKSNALTGKLYSLWQAKAAESKNSIHDKDAISFAKAYNDSLDTIKHGGKVSLPVHLHSDVNDRFHEFLK